MELNTKSAICLTSALSYYNLSDEIVTKAYVLVDASFYKKTGGQCILFRKRSPYWEVGIDEKKGFNITSIDRTIVESAFYKSHTGWDGTQAIKYSIDNKITTVQKLYEMAKKLDYLKKIRAHLEVFI